MSDLPVLSEAIDAEFPDDPLLPGRKLHQQHHGFIHTVYNRIRNMLPGAPNGLATLGPDGKLDPAQSGTIVSATTQAADYTLALADAGKVIEVTKATAAIVTVPPNATVAFPIGSIVEVLQAGAGQITLTAGAGVTLRSFSGWAKTTGQWSSALLRKRATDEWVLVGDLTA